MIHSILLFAIAVALLIFVAAKFVDTESKTDDAERDFWE